MSSAGGAGTGAAGVGSATTFYASPSGDDAKNGTSWATAKKTILAAYDALPDGGGTIHFADGTSIGGTVANQGLWILGPHDSSWNAPPAGWRKQKMLRLIGMPASSYPPNAIVGSAQLIAGGSTDTAKPGIWLTGTNTSLRFENVALYNTAAVCVRLGIDSRTGSDTNTATVTFFGCYFQPNSVAGAGPTIHVGWAYWVWFNKCGVAGNGNATTADTKAAILIKPRATSSYLFFLQDVQLDTGGVRYYSAGNTGWSFNARNITSEGLPANGVAIEFVSVNNLGNGIIDTLDMHDAGSGALPLKVDSSIEPAAVIVLNVSAVRGPCTRIGGWPPNWPSEKPNGFTIGGSSIVLPSVTSDPTVRFNGMIWYNSTSGTFKCYQNGAVKTFTVR